MKPRILVVDDEPPLAGAMAQVLRRRGYDVDVAFEGEQALSLLSRHDYALVLSDLRMPRMDGHQLVGRIRAVRPSLPVVVVTAYGTVESAVACVRDGAVDYLPKPFSPETLERAVSTALQRLPERRRSIVADLVAIDPATLETVELAQRAAAVDAIVLLEAESGAGKEVFARLIHESSPRSAGPFVAINCSALPKDLLETELFGHCRGAFTGALREHKGHFQAADGGTLFLDEIGEMSADLQSRLLRVLQDNVVLPVGAEASIEVDVRVIAATNRNLRVEVMQNRFREDLYYRLRVFPIRIPPLRERPGDIEPLSSRFARRYGGFDTRLSPAAVCALRSHVWPGNVRELENVIQRATILAGRDTIEVRHLDLQPALRPRERDAAAPVNLERAEREAIRHALIETGGNRGLAAAALGISPRTLRHKLQRYRDAGIAVEEAER